MSLNTSTALFTFPKDLGGLQIKMPRAVICSATWGHLIRCCQFDDGTRQLAEISYKDALEQHGCLDMEDLQIEAEFSTWDQASQNSFTFKRQDKRKIGWAQAIYPLRARLQERKNNALSDKGDKSSKTNYWN